MASQMNRTSSAAAGRARPWVVVSSVAVLAVAGALRLAGRTPATAAADRASPGSGPATGQQAGSETPARPLPAFIVDWEPVLRRDLFDASPFAPQTQPAQTAAVRPAAPAAQVFLADVQARLSLQATMAGPRPTAIINGQTHGVGDVVGDSYRIRRIEQRRIVLERDGVELEMTCE